MGKELLCYYYPTIGVDGVSEEAEVFERSDQIIDIELCDVCMVRIEPSDDCTHIVIWSDNPRSYVCVEPIFGKPGTFGKPEGRWIDPGERIECTVRLDFGPIK